MQGSPGPDNRETLDCRNLLAGGVHLGVERGADAVALAEKTLDLAKVRLGSNDADTIKFRNTLVLAYTKAGRSADAIGLGEESLRLAEASLGPDHENTLSIAQNLASVYLAVGRVADAIALGEKTLRLAEARLGPDHTTHGPWAHASSAPPIPKSGGWPRRSHSARRTSVARRPSSGPTTR